MKRIYYFYLNVMAIQLLKKIEVKKSHCRLYPEYTRYQPSNVQHLKEFGLRKKDAAKITNRHKYGPNLTPRALRLKIKSATYSRINEYKYRNYTVGTMNFLMRRNSKSRILRNCFPCLCSESYIYLLGHHVLRSLPNAILVKLKTSRTMETRVPLRK